MLNPQTNPTDACVDGFATYLMAQVPGLTVLREWPNANDKLKYPSVTLFQGKSQLMNLPPEILSTTAPDVNNQIVATEIIGEVDFKLQLDLWCSNKVQRDQYLGKIMDAINAQSVDATGNQNPAGLSLQLANYFNDWVRFDIDDYETVDDEAGAQRRERRAKIDILVNCRAIRQRTYYAITKLQVYGEATDSATLVDDSSATEITNVF